MTCILSVYLFIIISVRKIGIQEKEMLLKIQVFSSMIFLGICVNLLNYYNTSRRYIYVKPIILLKVEVEGEDGVPT